MTMLLVSTILFLIAGVVAGMLSALMGIGGGLIVVPVMYVFFRYIDPVAPNMVMHVAVGTSLAIMLVTTSNAIISHMRRGNVPWPVVKQLIGFIVLGVIAGTVISYYVHSEFLRYLFIAFLLYVLGSAILKKGFTQDFNASDFHLTPRYITIPVCVLTGGLSVMLGMGGSLMVVPYLRHCHMPMKRATAAAVALTPAVSIVGVIGYIYAGWGVSGLPRDCLSYVYVPAFIGISVGTFLGVPLGAYIGKFLSDRKLAIGYLVMLAVILILMIL